MSDCTPVDTPCEVNLHLAASDSPPLDKRNVEVVRNYQQLIGACMYLTGFTRGDCSFAVKSMCQVHVESRAHAHSCDQEDPALSGRHPISRYQRERNCFYHIIVQTYDVGLHSRRHPMEFDAGTRPFASFDAPSS